MEIRAGQKWENKATGKIVTVAGWINLCEGYNFVEYKYGTTIRTMDRADFEYLFSEFHEETIKRTNFDVWKEKHTSVSLANTLAGHCDICPLKVCTCTLNMGNPRCDCDCKHYGNCEYALYSYFEEEAEGK